MKRGVQAHAAYELQSNAVAVYLVERDAIATNVQFEKREPGAFYDPAFRLSMEDAQALMDQLWAAGLRPVEGRQSQGMAQAQARHLEDMRQIAFTKLAIEKPAA